MSVQFNKEVLHKMLPAEPGKHFCLAPFQSIRQNAYGKNSPCAFGAGEWDHGDLTPEERWNSAELNSLRHRFITGEQPSECSRCWAEEKAGKQSLRQRQFDYFPDDYDSFIKTGKWLDGPKTAVFKTSNVCNLACRSCAAWDTNTYKDEGEHYAKEYGTLDHKGKVYNRFMMIRPAKHVNFMQYTDIAKNLEKIDFFGGEPFLNITQLDLLEYLVKTGRSKETTLFYSTNCTNHPTTRLKKAWDHFKRVEISISIDGVGDKFEYMRWPGKWDESSEVLDHILSLKDSLNCDVYTMAGLTISLLNVVDVDNVHAWLTDKIGNTYINMVGNPEYLSLHVAPDEVKQALKARIKNQEALGYLDIKNSDPLAWKQFLIWTKRQDLYRGQDYTKTYPEFYQIIKEYWDNTIDLTEQNFYNI